MSAHAVPLAPTDPGAVPGAAAANRSLVAVAAAASAAAGLVHAAAAGTHEGHRTLVLLFAVTAAVQLGWAALAALRPGRRAAFAGIAVNGVAFAAWAASRTVGLPLIDSLRGVDAVGTQDVVAAGLAAASVLAAVAAIVPAWSRRRLGDVWVGAMALVVVALAVPGMAAQHAHSPSAEHVHGDGPTTVSATEADGHEHATAADAAAPAGAAAAATDHAHGTAAPAGGHDHGDVPARLDHDPTEKQKADARALVARTEAALAKFGGTDDALAAGYRSIGDGRRAGTYEHYINPDYLFNSTILDPTQPESLVFRHNADGSRTLTTAMYILPPGSTTDQVPDIAGNLTVWHSHDNLCFDPATGRLSGVVTGGACSRGVKGADVPMLHVWIEPNPCGPFAGTDAGAMSGSCVKEF